jgi:hypothetical protein
VSTELPPEPLSFSDGPIAHAGTSPPPVPKVSRSSLLLAGSGLALIVLSTFLPYARLVVSLGGLHLAGSRSAWQMGANGSIAFGAGPAIVLWSLVASFQEFLHYRPKAAPYWFQHRFFLSGIRTQALNAVVITVLCFLNWPGSWTVTASTNVTRGYGGYVTMLGVALFAVSVNFHYHDGEPATKARDTAR